MSTILDDIKGKKVLMYATDDMSIVNADKPGTMFVYLGGTYDTTGLYLNNEHIASGYGLPTDKHLDTLTYLATSYLDVTTQITNSINNVRNNLAFHVENFINDISHLAVNVDNLSTTVDAHDELIDDLSEQVIDLSTRVDSHGESIDRLFMNINEHDTSITTLTTRVDRHDTNIKECLRYIGIKDTIPTDIQNNDIYTNKANITYVYKNNVIVPIGTFSSILSSYNVSLDDFIVKNATHYEYIGPEVVNAYSYVRPQDYTLPLDTYNHIYMEPHMDGIQNSTYSVYCDGYTHITLKGNDFDKIDITNYNISYIDGLDKYNNPQYKTLSNDKVSINKSVDFKYCYIQARFNKILVNSNNLSGLNIYKPHSIFKDIKLTYSYIGDLYYKEFDNVNISYKDSHPLNTTGEIDILNTSYAPNANWQIRTVMPLYYVCDDTFNTVQFSLHITKTENGRKQTIPNENVQTLYLDSVVKDVCIHIPNNKVNTFKMAIHKRCGINNLICEINSISQKLVDISYYTNIENPDTQIPFDETLADNYRIFIFTFAEGNPLPECDIKFTIYTSLTEVTEPIMYNIQEHTQNPLQGSANMITSQMIVGDTLITASKKIEYEPNYDSIID